MDAKNNVVVSSNELNTADVKVGQRKSRKLDVIEDDEPMVALAEGIEDDPEAYAEAIAFMEEPITIRVNVPTQADDKHPPRTVQCWVNGKGAEQFTNGKWMQCGWLPLNYTVTTRRKYVEVLARAKQENISTRVIQHRDSEENIADRIAIGKYAISILNDNSPKAQEWIRTIISEQ